MTDCLPGRKKHYYGMERTEFGHDAPGLYCVRTHPTDCCVFCGKPHPNGTVRERYSRLPSPTEGHKQKEGQGEVRK